MIGTLLAKRYSIESILGEGGMGVVYKALDTLLDRPVAIKAVSAAMLSDEGARRLLREAQSAAKLTHPNIVGIYDVLEDSDQRLIVMEYVEGQTLRERIPMPWQDAVEIALRICDALGYAHEHGIVHRDIKPENVLTTAAGGVKVMDFGLARSAGRSRMTQSGMLVGTVAYMAPEQALSGSVDARSDLYSLGCVLYEVITGEAPFVADDPIAVISMHVNVPPVSPRFHRPEIPTVLEAAILRLLAKDPAERFATASNLGEMLRAAQAVPSLEEGETPQPAESSVSSLFDLMTRGRLVDRQEELATLKVMVEGMLSGRGQVVFLAGEPGIGKTRLAEEVLVYARLRGCLALVGRCYEQDMGVPYLPMADAVTAAVNALADDRLSSLAAPHAPELIKLIPELSRRFPTLAPSPALEPEQERLRLFRAVAGFLVDLSRVQPVLLFLDDLHWADAGALAMLRHLARQLKGERLLIIGSYRDVEVDPTHPLSPALQEMNRERLYTRVLLRGLAPQDVATMIQGVLQAAAVSEEVRDLIYRETEGNPFFIEEVLKHLVEVGALYLEDGRWQRKPIEDIDIPQSVREVIGRRLERVSEACLQVLSLGAVVGRRFGFEVLAAAGDFPEAPLLDALEEAVRAQLIHEETVAGDVRYDFAHALVREVLYERLGLRRRMSIHRKVGEALERLFTGRHEAIVEELAHHFLRAPAGEALQKAARYAREAGKKAMGLFAYEEAVRYYRQAAELLEEPGEESALVEVLVAVGEPYAYLGQLKEAVAAYERASAILQRRGAPRDELARIRRLIGRVLQRGWEYAEAIPHLERALADLTSDRFRDEAARIHLDLARAKGFTGAVEEAKAHAKEALELARTSESPLIEAEAHATLGVLAMNAMDPEGARQHYTTSIHLARQLPDRDAAFTLIRSLGNMGFLHEVQGNFAEWESVTQEALQAARRVRSLDQVTFITHRMAWSYFFKGDWTAARRHTLEQLGLPLSPRFHHRAQHRHYVLEGDRANALVEAQWINEDLHRTKEVQGILASSGFIVWHLNDLARPSEALPAASEALQIFETRRDPNVIWVAMFIVEALAEGGDLPGSGRMCAMLAEAGEALASPGMTGSALFGRALVAAAERNLNDAVRLAQESLPLLRRQGTFFAARALRRYASLLLDRRSPGDADRARTSLLECLELVEAMEDQVTAGAVRSELEQIGVEAAVVSPGTDPA